MTFDSYTVKARLLPTFIVLLPVVLLCFSLFPEIIEGWKLLASLLVSFGSTMLLSQLGRDLGKSKEQALFKSWGGSPTFLICSHKNSWLDRNTRNRYIRNLEETTKILSPTIEIEEKTPQIAYEVYSSYSNFLREKTRDKIKYSLVFAENINYGFRRNLWALKPLGIFTSLLGCFLPFIFLSANKESIQVIWVICTILISITLLAVWFLVINTNWVKTLGMAYAERLFGTIDS